MEQLNISCRPVHRMDIAINMKATGANIKRLIKTSGYSVRDIMEITGISTEQAIYKWFRGESLPSIDSMIILCNALGIEIKELLVIDGEFDSYTAVTDKLDSDNIITMDDIAYLRTICEVQTVELG